MLSEELLTIFNINKDCNFKIHTLTDKLNVCSKQIQSVTVKDNYLHIITKCELLSLLIDEITDVEVLGVND